MKFKYIFALFYLIVSILTLQGCSSPLHMMSSETVTDSKNITIGNTLTITNTNPSLQLLDVKNVLSDDGLYYATWSMGEASPYVNSENKTVDLYDAQLYLLVEESENETTANHSMTNWMNLSKNNYDIQAEETIICADQQYTMITYTCNKETTPYAKGVSVFSTYNNSAICIELTCVESFDNNLIEILTNFLNQCDYGLKNHNCSSSNKKVR